MNVPPSISNAALQRLKAWEGSVPYVYDDGDRTYPKRRIQSYNTRGYPTIGVGHLITAAEQDRFRPYLGAGNMPEAEILALLAADVQRLSSPLRARIQVPITQSMWDALVLQAFNTGPYTPALKAAIERINAKDWRGAQAALASGYTRSKGIVLPGLVARRKAEADWFMAEGPPHARTFAEKSSKRLRALYRHRRALVDWKYKQRILAVAAAGFASIAVLALAQRAKM